MPFFNMPTYGFGPGCACGFASDMRVRRCCVCEIVCKSAITNSLRRNERNANECIHRNSTRILFPQERRRQMAQAQYVSLYKCQSMLRIFLYFSAYFYLNLNLKERGRKTLGAMADLLRALVGLPLQSFCHLNTIPVTLGRSLPALSCCSSHWPNKRSRQTRGEKKQQSRSNLCHLLHLRKNSS